MIHSAAVCSCSAGRQARAFKGLFYCEQGEGPCQKGLSREGCAGGVDHTHRLKTGATDRTRIKVRSRNGAFRPPTGLGVLRLRSKRRRCGRSFAQARRFLALPPFGKGSYRPKCVCGVGQLEKWVSPPFSPMSGEGTTGNREGKSGRFGSGTGEQRSMGLRSRPSIAGHR